MANHDQATELLKTLLFTGEPGDKKFDGEKPLSATDFMKCIKDRKATYTWSEVRTMGHVAGSLRGYAAEWYTKTQKALLSPADYLLFTTDFTTHFLKEFKLSFDVSSDAVAIDWTDIIKQRSTESAGQYITRIFGEMHRLSEIVTDLPLPHFTAATLSAEGTALLTDSMTPAQRAALAPHLAAQEAATTKAAQEASVLSYNNQIARRLILAGLRSATLKEKAWAFHRDEENTQRFYKLLMQETRHDELNGASKKNHSTSEVAVVLEDSATVEKVGGGGNNRRNRGNNRNAGNQQPQQQNQPPSQRPNCGYCGKPFHSERNCFYRIQHEKLGVSRDRGMRVCRETTAAEVQDANGQAPSDGTTYYAAPSHANAASGPSYAAAASGSGSAFAVRPPMHQTEPTPVWAATTPSPTGNSAGGRW